MIPTFPGVMPMSLMGKISKEGREKDKLYESKEERGDRREINFFKGRKNKSKKVHEE